MLVPVLLIVGLACDPAEGDHLCQRALSEYCDGDCPSITDVLSWCSHGKGPVRSECADLTVVDCSGDLGGRVYYFESAGDIVGELTAVYEYSDTPDFCPDLPAGGSRDVWYGEIPPEECRPW